jgi:radical SAM protein with 4Fe4S-binding SPASM domain
MSNNLHYALWELTQRCNLCCIHCRAAASPQTLENNLIKGEDMVRLIRELKELGCPTLALTGGEPLLRPDIVDIVKEATKQGIKTRIQSNSLLLTEDLAKKLKAAGLYSFGVGLDGSRPEISDQIRNLKGALNKAIASIKLLKSLGIKVHVEFTVTRLNMNDLKATLDMLEGLGVDTFLARAAIFTGRANGDNPIFVLKPEEYRKFLEQLSLEREHRKIKMVINCQDPLYHLADSSIMNKLKEFGDVYSGKVISGCTAGQDMIHIRCDGKIGICTFLQDVVLGDFYQDSLVDIWNNRRAVKGVQQLINREYSGACGTCCDRFICGGCRARALLINNDLLAADPYCWKNKK